MYCGVGVVCLDERGALVGHHIIRMRTSVVKLCLKVWMRSKNSRLIAKPMSLQKIIVRQGLKNSEISKHVHVGLQKKLDFINIRLD